MAGADQRLAIHRKPTSHVLRHDLELLRQLLQLHLRPVSSRSEPLCRRDLGRKAKPWCGFRTGSHERTISQPRATKGLHPAASIRSKQSAAQRTGAGLSVRQGPVSGMPSGDTSAGGRRPPAQCSCGGCSGRPAPTPCRPPPPFPAPCPAPAVERATHRNQQLRSPPTLSRDCYTGWTVHLQLHIIVTLPQPAAPNALLQEVLVVTNKLLT